MSVTLVVNPHAGKQTILRELSHVQSALMQGGEEVSVKMTETREQADHAIQQAILSRPDVLVCCGGDGTLSETINQMINHKAWIPLGYIPAGTTNDFANSLGIPKEPVKAAELIARGRPKPLDVGRFGYKYFIYVASFGAFTQSSYSTSQNLKNTLGHLAYVIEGIKELPTLKSYHVRVETAEGRVYEDEYVFGSLSNSTSFGGIVKLDSDKVDLSDGKFELTLVKMPRNLLELNRVLLSLMSGKFDEGLITFVSTPKAVFTCEEPMPWSLDGEYAAGGTRVEVEAVSGKLKMFY